MSGVIRSISDFPTGFAVRQRGGVADVAFPSHATPDCLAHLPMSSCGNAEVIDTKT